MDKEEAALRGCIDSGAFAGSLADWDIDDLSLLALEVKRGEVIAEIVDADQDKIIKAIDRLGWGEHIVQGLAEGA